VTAINAHGHNKNHPSGFKRTQYVIDQLLQLPTDEITSIYPHPLHLDVVAKDLNIAINEIGLTHNQQSIRQYQTQDYNQLLSYTATQSRVIFVSGGNDLNLYHQATRSFERMPLSQVPAESAEQIHNELEHLFFGDSIHTWTNQNLTDIWDIRERRALQSNVIATAVDPKDLPIDFSFPHYWMDCRSWWFDGISMIQDIIAWLELKIDRDRFQEWIPIYHDWQKIQAKNLKFQLNYQHIVDCVVNNWSYPIDLTFEEEVVIQHCLIYQHNLNLKTWQLTKFPNNTQELHKLLEPNIHTI
jgi:hypothetical protein